MGLGDRTHLEPMHFFTVKISSLILHFNGCTHHHHQNYSFSLPERDLMVDPLRIWVVCENNCTPVVHQSASLAPFTLRLCRGLSGIHPSYSFCSFLSFFRFQPQQSAKKPFQTHQWCSRPKFAADSMICGRRVIEQIIGFPSRLNLEPPRDRTVSHSNSTNLALLSMISHRENKNLQVTFLCRRGRKQLLALGILIT